MEAARGVGVMHKHGCRVCHDWEIHSRPLRAGTANSEWWTAFKTFRQDATDFAMEDVQKQLAHTRALLEDERKSNTNLRARLRQFENDAHAYKTVQQRYSWVQQIVAGVARAVAICDDDDRVIPPKRDVKGKKRARSPRPFYDAVPDDYKPLEYDEPPSEDTTSPKRRRTADLLDGPMLGEPPTQAVDLPTAGDDGLALFPDAPMLAEDVEMGPPATDGEPSHQLASPTPSVIRSPAEAMIIAAPPQTHDIPMSRPAGDDHSSTSPIATTAPPPQAAPQAPTRTPSPFLHHPTAPTPSTRAPYPTHAEHIAILRAEDDEDELSDDFVPMIKNVGPTSFIGEFYDSFPKEAIDHFLYHVNGQMRYIRDPRRFYDNKKSHFIVGKNNTAVLQDGDFPHGFSDALLEACKVEHDVYPAAEPRVVTFARDGITPTSGPWSPITVRDALELRARALRDTADGIWRGWYNYVVTEAPHVKADPVDPALAHFRDLQPLPALPRNCATRLIQTWDESWSLPAKAHFLLMRHEEYLAPKPGGEPLPPGLRSPEPGMLDFHLLRRYVESRGLHGHFRQPPRDSQYIAALPVLAEVFRNIDAFPDGPKHFRPQMMEGTLSTATLLPWVRDRCHASQATCRRWKEYCDNALADLTARGF